VIFTVYHKD